MRAAPGLLLLVGVLALGQAPVPEDPAVIRQRLAEVQGRMAQVDQQLTALKKRRKGVLIELQQITLQAEQARAQADGARLKRDQAQSEVGALARRKDQIRTEIQGLRGALRHQIRWMQALGPMGHISFLPSLTSFEHFLVQDRYLTWWRNRERQRLVRVQGLQGELVTRERELQEALERLKREEGEAAKLQGGLTYHETRLQAFLDGIQQDEGRQKAIQAELTEEAIQLDRMLTNLLGKTREEGFAAGVPFLSLRGELPQPVGGTLAQGYGEHLHPKYRTKTFQSGLLIQAASGTPVQAVAAGRVFYAEFFQTYGPTVILDHGGGFYTLYTHLQSLVVRKGQVLQAGAVLGSVGDTAEGPRLGFQIRQQATPQDPMKWLKQKYK